jgi:truncated hemoglobin YjbI
MKLVIHLLDVQTFYVNIKEDDTLKTLEEEINKEIKTQKINTQETNFTNLLFNTKPLEGETIKECGLEDESSIYINCKKTQKIMENFETFKKSEDKEYFFSKGLSGNERKLVHCLSGFYGVESSSTGNSFNRIVKISKEKNEKKVYKFQKNIPLGMSEIIQDFLYLGSGKDAFDSDQLTKNKIQHVLNVTSVKNIH